MTRETPIDPPIIVEETSGTPTKLSTVEEFIEFVRRRGSRENWEALRNAAFVAAAVPSPENIEKLRTMAAEAFRR